MTVRQPLAAAFGHECKSARGAPRRRAPRHDTPARVGIRGDDRSWSSAASLGGAHQHEAQAHAVTYPTSLATATCSGCGLRLMANAAIAPTATSAAPIMTAGFMPSTNC